MVKEVTESLSLLTALDVRMITDFLDKGNLLEPTNLNLNIKYLTRIGNYELICRKWSQKNCKKR